MNQLPPVQFDLHKLWLQSWRELIAKESVKDALDKIQEFWIEIAESEYDESSPQDEELAHEELLLDMHTGQVKIKDLDWLRKTFENSDLAELSLAIAEELMPEKTWEIVDRGEEAVVTDAERSIVFDIKHGRKLPAGVSLLIAGDQKYQPSRSELEEFSLWISNRADSQNRALGKLRNILDKFDDSGTVLDLSKRRPS